MGVLQRFERRVQHLVDGAFARAFKAEVQPVEVASALARECDDRAAIVGRGRTIVPNAFVVELGRSDHERLSGLADTLAAELATAVREHADDQGYSFIGPVDVAFEEVDELDTGVFRIRSASHAGGTGRPATALLSRSSSRRTLATLEVDGRGIPLAGGATVIGRGAEADVRVDDPGVSRRHAEVRLTTAPAGGRGTPSAEVVDLGSTNGTAVDGQRTPRAALRDGSRITVGTTTLVFRSGG